MRAISVVASAFGSSAATVEVLSRSRPTRIRPSEVSREDAGAGLPDGAGRAHDGEGGVREIDPEQAAGAERPLDRGGDGIAVACRHADRRAPGHRDPTVAHHAGECPETDELRAARRRDLGALDDPVVDFLHRHGLHHHIGRERQTDEPAFGLGAGDAPNALDLAYHERRFPFRELLHRRVRDEPHQRVQLLLELAGAQRVDPRRRSASRGEGIVPEQV